MKAFNQGVTKCKFLSELSNLDVIWEEPAVNSFRRMGHEAAPFECSLLEKPGKGTTMIQVKTRGIIHGNK